jgi:hypothetical protein
MSQTKEKLDGIYEATLQKERKSRLLTISAFVSFGVMLVSGSLATVYAEEGSIWIQPLIVQILMVVMFVSVIASFFSIEYSKIMSFEKGIFLKIYDAWKCLARYDSLSGSVSQEHSDLDRAMKLMHNVSKKFMARKDKSKLSDIGKEVNAKYHDLGVLIQNRILPNLQKENELARYEEKLLELAEVFADISFNRLHSCTDGLRKLPESERFKPKPSFLEAHSDLRSALIHIGKFSVSSVVVASVALLLSNIFQRPISEFAPYILTSIFVLFVAWEFKSK